MVRPDDGAIDHLQAGIAATTVVQGIKDQLPQAGLRPAPELTINTRPFAEIIRQIPPRNPGAGNPEYAIQHKTVVPRLAPAQCARLHHKRFKTRPFFVTQQSTNQNGLPKSHLESLKN